MADQINSRKEDHLRAIERDADIERHASGFDAIRLTHRALPELDFDAIDTRVSFIGKELSMPLLISSMTGGDSDEILRINRNLAEAAEECGVAMAVGSQRVMFSTPAARKSFALRDYAPTTVLLGNIGAVQLNKGFGADECQQAVDVLQADGLYLHLNPLQEAIQPEGDRDFSGLARKIAKLVPQMDVPILLKEVGAGLSPADIVRGLQAGIRHFDVAGRGGTSWSRIEYHRRKDDADDLGLVFQDWGLTTVEALTAAKTTLETGGHDATLIASGGLRNGVDMAKAILLGADICGIAAPFLAAAQDSRGAVINQINALHREFRTAMFLLGCTNCDELRRCDGLLK
ncbi:isopentenyl pyrophosphate isomerase [Actibacterium atlanticum]|uniref:Isopentenyl-diphosphate delta-isomerase n=1 Tax=Actibacterium atlanticum TaxID=1461693 RepID=A0A058ZJH8_9RHOB|nr:type 2 isopentenyl-diphosphate Delta-isomerase [Actibacterium atlanticum]KCV81749.1 isopentenyl pyrophosphate isomerase [Actibacterium atlanticum]